MLVNQLFSVKSLYCKSRTVSRTKRSCKKNTSQSQNAVEPMLMVLRTQHSKEHENIIAAMRVSPGFCAQYFTHLVFPFLFFSIPSGFTNFLPYFWPHVTWSSCRLNFCQYPTGPQISFGKFFFQLCESSPRVCQVLDRIVIPVVVNSFFLYDVQISARRFCYVPVLQVNRECFFLKHIELNSGFIAITIDEVTLNRPEVGTGFSVIG